MRYDKKRAIETVNLIFVLMTNNWLLTDQSCILPKSSSRWRCSQARLGLTTFSRLCGSRTKSKSSYLPSKTEKIDLQTTLTRPFSTGIRSWWRSFSAHVPQNTTSSPNPTKNIKQYPLPATKLLYHNNFKSIPQCIPRCVSCVALRMRMSGEDQGFNSRVVFLARFEASSKQTVPRCRRINWSRTAGQKVANKNRVWPGDGSGFENNISTCLAEQSVSNNPKQFLQNGLILWQFLHVQHTNWPYVTSRLQQVL